MYQYKFGNGRIPIDTQVNNNVLDGYAVFNGGEPVDWSDNIAPAPEPISLEEAQACRVVELKTCRNNAEAATPFVYDGSSFDYDALSRERINAAVSAATIAALSGVATSTVICEWTLADNTTRDMTIADWLAFRQAEIARSSACHSKYNTLKEQVGAATTVEEINAINW